MKLNYKVTTKNVNANGIGILTLAPDFKEHKDFHKVVLPSIVLVQLKESSIKDYNVGDSVKVTIEKA